MTQNTHDDDAASRGAAPDSAYDDADVHPGWADQPQGSYAEADSGGWGAPGRSDTGPIRLTDGNDGGSDAGGSQGSETEHPEDPEHTVDGTTSYGQDSFGQAGYVREPQEPSEHDAAAATRSEEGGGPLGSSLGHDAPFGESDPPAQAGHHDPYGPQGGWAAVDGSSSYAAPSTGPSTYGLPPQAASQYGPPSYGPSSQGESTYDESAYGQPAYGEPPRSPSQYGPSQYAQPQYAQPQYGPSQYAQPQYAQPQYAQPQYGPPAHGPAGGAGYASGPHSGPGHTPPRKGLAAVFDFTFVSKATRTLAPLLFWLVVTWGFINIVYVIVTLASLPAYGRSGGVVFFGILTALFDVLVKVALARVFLELCVNVSDMAERRSAGQR